MTRYEKFMIKYHMKRLAYLHEGVVWPHILVNNLTEVFKDKSRKEIEKLVKEYEAQHLDFTFKFNKERSAELCLGIYNFEDESDYFGLEEIDEEVYDVILTDLWHNNSGCDEDQMAETSAYILQKTYGHYMGGYDIMYRLRPSNSKVDLKRYFKTINCAKEDNEGYYYGLRVEGREMHNAYDSGYVNPFEGEI